MKENLLKFLVKFLLVSLPLFTFWFWLGDDWYSVFYEKLVFVLFKIFQKDSSNFPIPTSFFNNLVPFTVLMIITPGIHYIRKIYLILFGNLIILAEHLLVGIILYFLDFVLKVSDQTFSLILTPLSILSGTFPFLLWLILASEEIKSWFWKK